MYTQDKGINYGPITNIDTKTNIRYGVIPHSTVGQSWYDDSEAYYLPICPNCGEELDSYDVEKCDRCNEDINDHSFDMLEPLSFFIDDKEYQAEQDCDSPDIFITKSPYYTYAQFCSPCAPGACYLLNPIEDKDPDNKCYCFGHDWFENGKAPYPVYDIKTDKLIQP